MTAVSVLTIAAASLLGIAAAFAVADWAAVASGRHLAPVRWVTKPAVLLALIGAAATLDPADGLVRAAFVVALVFSLAGDVFLLFPDRWFVAGLVAFLLGHLAYISGLIVEQRSLAGLAVGVLVVAAALAVIAPTLVRGVRGSGQADMLIPVAAYMAVISVMVVCAFGAADPFAIIGALLFYVSDTTIGWTRFVAAKPWDETVVIVTYHLAQAFLVLSLLF